MFKVLNWNLHSFRLLEIIQVLVSKHPAVQFSQEDNKVMIALQDNIVNTADIELKNEKVVCFFA